MLVLGLDTSASAVELALVRDGSVLGERHLAGRGGHEHLLGDAVRGLLAESAGSARSLDLVAAGLGPGSFTGLRIGVTFAKTLALALGVPLVGVPGPAAVARDAARSGVVAVLDRAHPGRVYGAAFDVTHELPELLRPVDLWDPAALLSSLPRGFVAAGSAAADHGDAVARAGGRTLPVAAGVRAATVARLAAARLAAGGPPDDPRTLAPLYGQPSAPERGA